MNLFDDDIRYSNMPSGTNGTPTLPSLLGSSNIETRRTKSTSAEEYLSAPQPSTVAVHEVKEAGDKKGGAEITTLWRDLASVSAMPVDTDFGTT
jgi:hypothetical protein